jgi:hypothetical protein
MSKLFARSPTPLRQIIVNSQPVTDCTVVLVSIDSSFVHYVDGVEIQASHQTYMSTLERTMVANTPRLNAIFDSRFTRHPRSPEQSLPDSRAQPLLHGL